MPAATMIGLGARGSDADVRALHERFVSDPDNTDLSPLRPLIARSWARSVTCKVDPGRTTFEACREPQVDELVLRNAHPVLDELARMSADTAAGVWLADHHGTVADFRADDHVRRSSDEGLVAMGSVMAEDISGTNGEGTAIEEAGAVQIWGGEHFCAGLQDFYCTSVPVVDPLRRSVRAVLSLSLPQSVATGVDPRTIALIARAAAAELNQLLVAGLAVREQALLASYLAEVRKRGADSVVVMDERTTIASKGALHLLGEGDYAVLAGYARESERLARPLEREVAIGPRSVLRVDARPIQSGGATLGSVLRLRLAASAERTTGITHAARRTDRFTALAGNSVPLRRALQVASTAVRRRLPACIIGEPGTGKATLAAAMAAQMSEHVQTWDGRRDDVPDKVWVEALAAALDGGAAVVLTHADALAPNKRSLLSELLTGVENPMVLLTVSRLPDPDDALLRAVGCVEVALPPLRNRREDIPQLVDRFLASAAHGVLRVSPQLLRALAEAEWSGNLLQLRRFVDTAAARCESVELGMQHLSESHRQILAPYPLSRLEDAELRQIREALVDAGGNRVRAAELLEIGRSTLYRKIEVYQRRGYDIES